MGDIRHLDVHGRSIAYRLRPGNVPTLLFLPGYASDMEGTKALALDRFAEARGLGMLRLDFRARDQAAEASKTVPWRCGWRRRSRLSTD